MDATPGMPARILFGLIAAGVVYGLYALSRHSGADQRGWRHVKAGPMHLTGVSLGAALTGLMSYVWLFVGSSRPDAESQMTILFYLIIAFGCGSIIVALQAWMIGRRAIRWRGKSVRFSLGGQAETREFQDIAAIQQTLWGRVAFKFKDGAVLMLDPYAQGAGELIDAARDFLEAQPGNAA